MTRRSINTTYHLNIRLNMGVAIAVVLVAVLTGTSAGSQLVPSAERITSAAEFSLTDVQSRQRFLRAWAHEAPDTAGIALLPLLEAGLNDADRDVRLYATTT